MSKNQYGIVRTVGSRDNQYPNGYWDNDNLLEQVS